MEGSAERSSSGRSRSHLTTTAGPCGQNYVLTASPHWEHKLVLTQPFPAERHRHFVLGAKTEHLSESRNQTHSGSKIHQGNPHSFIQH
jgi:hypothetical protein